MYDFYQSNCNKTTKAEVYKNVRKIRSLQYKKMQYQKKKKKKEKEQVFAVLQRKAKPIVSVMKDKGWAITVLISEYLE